MPGASPAHAAPDPVRRGTLARMSHPQIPALDEAETFEQWRNLLAYHAPVPGQQEVYETNRRWFIELAEYLFNTLPPSEERRQTLRHLSFTLMLANQTVAVHAVTARPSQ